MMCENLTTFAPYFTIINLFSQFSPLRMRGTDLMAQTSSTDSERSRLMVCASGTVHDGGAVRKAEREYVRVTSLVIQ